MQTRNAIIHLFILVWAGILWCPIQSLCTTAPLAAADMIKEIKGDTIAKDTVDTGFSQNLEYQWGSYSPGKGFKVAKTKMGSLDISAYLMFRYLNQLTGDSTWTDHNGVVKPLPNRRQDIQNHRVLVWLNGWVFDPRLNYMVNFWTTNSANGVGTSFILVGLVSYTFKPALTITGGIVYNPANRTNQGQWPYFHGTDRTMADEFFKGGGAIGVSATGKMDKAGKFSYKAVVSNTNNNLGIDGSQLDRKFTYGGSIWYMSNGEFGPRNGGMGDFEHHDKPAGMIGVYSLYSPEQRFTGSNNALENASIRLSDGLNIFETNALGPNATISSLKLYSLSVGGGIKYKGLSLTGDIYYRKLMDLVADASLNESEITNTGFQALAGYMVVRKRMELYSTFSKVYGDFGDPYDMAFGVNYFPFKERGCRLNLEYLYTKQSPVGGLFLPHLQSGTGPIIHASFELFF
jgi:hypothetical protein